MSLLDKLPFKTQRYEVDILPNGKVYVYKEFEHIGHEACKRERCSKFQTPKCSSFESHCAFNCQYKDSDGCMACRFDEKLNDNVLLVNTFHDEDSLKTFLDILEGGNEDEKIQGI